MTSSSDTLPLPPPRLHNMYRNIEERKHKQEEISPFLKTLTLKHKRYLKFARCTILCATQQPIAPEVLDCRHQDVHLLHLPLVFRVPLSHILVLVVCCIALQRSSTIVDLIRLSPLLIYEDDGDQDDNLSHNAKEGPEGSQAAADAQMDLVDVLTNLIDSQTHVVAHVLFNVQVQDHQSCPIRGALDLIFVWTGAIGDSLSLLIRLHFEPGPVSWQWVSMADTDQHSLVVLIAMLSVFVSRNMRGRFDFDGLGNRAATGLKYTFILSARTGGDLVQGESRVWSALSGCRVIDDFAVVQPMGALDGQGVSDSDVAAEHSRGLVGHFSWISSDECCLSIGSASAQDQGSDSPEQLHD